MILRTMTAALAVIGAASLAVAPSFAQAPTPSSKLAPETASRAAGAKPMEQIQAGSSRTVAAEPGQTQGADAAKPLPMTTSGRTGAK